MPVEDNRFYELIAKYLRQDISDEEYNALFTEITSKEERKVVFETLTKSSKKIRPKDVLEFKYAHVQHKIADLPNNLSDEPIMHRAPRRLLWWYAASILLIIGIGFGFYQYSMMETSILVEVPKGEKKNITLADGTQVWLNGGSNIRYSSTFGKTNRNIVLSGEAYFSVTKNNALPMVVEAKQVKIEVLGTTFNVRAYEDEPNIETTLVEGKVQLYIDNDKSLSHAMEPGDLIEIAPRKPDTFAGKKRNKEPVLTSTKKIKEDLVLTKKHFLNIQEQGITAAIAWKDNMLVFDNEPLASAISKIEKWYNANIDITNPELNTLRISGTFKEPSVKELLSVLKISGATFDYHVEGDNVTIY